MKVFIVLALFFVASMATFTEEQYQLAFTRWMQKHSKSYNHNEFRGRYATFKTNMDYIANYNTQKNGVTLAMNQFGDLSNAEFKQFYLGYRMPSNIDLSSWGEKVESVIGAPTTMDWRQKGAVTSIKNQGQCGSCWSFSTTGSTEGCHFLAGHKLVGLSEQNLMDCSTAQGNQGCNGGLMTAAMDYIISNNGVDTESSYPYTAEDGTCSFSASNVGATLKSYTNVASGDEKSLLNAAAKGPVSVAIDASHNSFQFYSSGVYYESACSSQQLDHGVLVVGYGNDSGQDFWLVKNSWGTSWGMEGYIEMSRNKNNNCGIATMATLPSC
jgi:cathepsin L